MSPRRYNVGGAVPSGNSVYVHRPQDEKFLASVEAGNWVEISGCRTMGKTSMAMRWRQALSEQDISVAYADLAGHIGWRPAPPTTLHEWIIKLGTRLALDLDLPSVRVLSALEGKQSGSPGELLGLLLSKIQEEIKGRLLVILDEVDV